MSLTGELCITAAGREYRLHLGFRALAALQDKHGQDVLQRLSPPDGADQGWMPPLGVVVDLVTEALRRHHAADIAADAWLPDDILREHPDLLASLMTAAFPQVDQDGAGNGQRSATPA